MNFLAIMLDNWPDEEWSLFPWCVYCPALTVAISWGLIRWKKKLVMLAVVVAVGAASSILYKLHAEIRYRAESKARLEAILQHTQQDKPGSPTYVTAQHQAEFLQAMRRELERFDSEPLQGIPAYDGRLIAAIWFAAVFPFFMITTFYFGAPKPPKERT